MLGNAFFGDLLLYDLVLFYTLKCYCHVESIFFIWKFLNFKLYRDNALTVKNSTCENINIIHSKATDDFGPYLSVRMRLSVLAFGEGKLSFSNLLRRIFLRWIAFFAGIGYTVNEEFSIGALSGVHGSM